MTHTLNQYIVKRDTEVLGAVNFGRQSPVFPAQAVFIPAFIDGSNPNTGRAFVVDRVVGNEIYVTDPPSAEAL